MKKLFVGVIASFTFNSVNASVLYDNPWSTEGAICSFSTTCAAQALQGNDFAAQEFTLVDNAVVNSASFTIWDIGTQPTAVNWGIYSVGGDGLPGSLMAFGSDTAISSSQFLGDYAGYSIDQEFFNLPAVALAAGNYYLAIQAVSSDFFTYLSAGSAMSGAAKTHDGGLTWQPFYGGEGFIINSVAVGLYGTYDQSVPEPSSIALLSLGLASLGAARRRKSA